MSESNYIKAKVISTSPLSPDEKTTLDEIMELRKSSLRNLLDAFRQILTLSTSIIALQITLLELRGFSLTYPLDLREFLVLTSLFFLLLASLSAVVGQLSGRIHLPTLDMLKEYRRYRDERLNTDYSLYLITSLLFIIGFVVFMVNSFLLFT